MKAYELLFFVDPNLDPETRLAVMKRIDTTIAEGNGKVDNVDEWLRDGDTANRRHVEAVHVVPPEKNAVTNRQ